METQNQEIQPNNQSVNRPVNRLAPKRAIPTFIGIAIIVAVAAVLFGGVFAYQYFFVKPQPVVESPQTSTDQTAGWRSFSSEIGGYNIKYPSNWSLSLYPPKKPVWFDMGKELLCLSDTINHDCSESHAFGLDGNFIIDVYENTDKRDLNTIINEWENGEIDNWKYKPEQFKKIEINGLPGILLQVSQVDADNKEAGSKRGFLINQNFVYQIGINYKTNDELVNAEAVLSTFKFTTPSQTVGPALSGVEGWKTYTNSDYGYEIKYSSDWKISDVGEITKTQRGITMDFYSPEWDSKSVFPIRVNAFKNENQVKNLDGLLEKDNNKTIIEIKNPIKDYTIEVPNNYEKIEIGGMPAFLWVGKGTITSVVLKDDYFYVIYGGGYELPLDVQKEYRLFISTFKFIDANNQAVGSVRDEETEAVNVVIEDAIRLKITALPKECISATVKSQGVGEIVYDLREVHNIICGGDPNTSPLILSARIELPSGQISFLNLTPSQIFQIASSQLGFARSQLVYFRVFGQDKIQYSFGSGTNFAYSGGQQQWYLIGTGNYQGLANCSDYKYIPSQYNPGCIDVATGKAKYMDNKGQSINYPPSQMVSYIGE